MIPEVESDDEDSVMSGLSAGLEPPKTVGRIHLANAGRSGQHAEFFLNKMAVASLLHRW